MHFVDTNCSARWASKGCSPGRSTTMGAIMVIPDFRFMRSMVRERLPRARFLDWGQVRERYPMAIDQFREVVEIEGFKISDALFYEHAGGISISLPPKPISAL